MMPWQPGGASRPRQDRRISEAHTQHTAPNELISMIKAVRAVGIEVPIIQAPMGGRPDPRCGRSQQRRSFRYACARGQTIYRTLRQQVREIGLSRQKTVRSVNLGLEVPQAERLEAFAGGVQVISFFGASLALGPREIVVNSASYG